MADIVIVVDSIFATDNGDELDYNCQARCSTMTVSDPTIVFHAFGSPSANASMMNATIRDAGVAAAASAGFTVGASDKKTILGGAV